MPYVDPAQQRAAKRASAQRKRAERRGTIVEPAITAADLALVGEVLRHRQGAGESDAAYRERMREVWRTLLRVVG
jgi:hypothetical protein